MNVGIVVFWFSPHGGMERHVTNLARSLRHRHDAVYCETPDNSSIYIRELVDAGMGHVAAWASAPDRTHRFDCHPDLREACFPTTSTVASARVSCQSGFPARYRQRHATNETSEVH
jgi:hypothetical protein